MAMAAAPAPSPRRKPVPQFRNPVIWEDLADLDIFRVGDTFYYSASNMHYSPGAPILRSYDLVHWEYVGHAVPRLDFSPLYDLEGGNAYVKGTWASFSDTGGRRRSSIGEGVSSSRKPTSTRRPPRKGHGTEKPF